MFTRRDAWASQDQWKKDPSDFCWTTRQIPTSRISNGRGRSVWGICACVRGRKREEDKREVEEFMRAGAYWKSGHLDRIRGWGTHSGTDVLTYSGHVVAVEGVDKVHWAKGSTSVDSSGLGWMHGCLSAEQIERVCFCGCFCGCFCERGPCGANRGGPREWQEWKGVAGRGRIVSVVHRDAQKE